MATEHANYMANRYWNLKAIAFALLGNECRRCGATDGQFQIDHIQWQSKTGHNGRPKGRGGPSHYFAGGGGGLTAFYAALERNELQLLCVPCHFIKSGYDLAEQYRAGLPTPANSLT